MPAHRTGLAVLLVAASGCASAPASRQGEFVTVAELRARQAGAAGPDSAAPAPQAADASGAGPAAGAASDAATEQPVAQAPDPAAPVTESRPADLGRGEGRPANRRFPRPRWIQIEDPDPAVIPMVLFEDPIADVMRSLSEAVRVNIVLDQDTVVRGMRLTAEVHDLPWPLALEAVLEAHRLRPVQLPSGVIKIVTEASARADQEVEEVALRFLTARDVQTALEGILRAGADSSSARVEYVGDAETTRRLVVYGSPEKLAQVRSLVARLDRRPPTISVETRIVNVDRTRMRRVGI
ncbi:MAG TPA: secretin N-terminal domain-containing protein, partial [Longimicrobium sp.]|nr:secretin N-terminal domain-containing protein [Longimicrobium sp.]